MADVDRISELPESVLHHILSFLSQKQATQTSALSRTWRHVGPTRPKIELREICFAKSGRAGFLSILDDTLQSYIRRNLSLQEFVFQMGAIDHRSTSLLDQAIPMVLINMGVRKFDFSVPNYLVAPSAFFRAVFLTELHLGECIFPSSIDHDYYDEAISKSLRRLSLSNVHIEDEALEKVIRAFPLIEYLLLQGWDGFTSIQVGKKVSIFQAEFLKELHLSGCSLVGCTSSSTELLLMKHLKTLSLDKVDIREETLEKIICSCPVIERLYVYDCVGLTTISFAPNVSIFQAEFLTELHLSGCKIMSSSTELLLMKRLKTLSLNKVEIREETLEKIISSCPLIERVLLSECAGLTTIRLNKSHNNNNLKQFSCCFNLLRTNSIEIDVPTLETIHILNCPNWYGHDKYLFSRLKSLYLSKVRISAELFDSFSFKFPSLEDLELQHCHGFREIQLTLSSIKRLVIVIDSIREIEATIHAPKISYFELSGLFPPRLNFYTETTCREWKSHVVMLFNNRSDSKVFQWLLQLSKLLNSLRESQISLDVSSYPLRHLKVEDDPSFCKPVIVEHVRVKGDYQCSSSSLDLLNCLFLICRPQYIYINWYTMDAQCNGLAKAIIIDIIRNQGDMSRGHLWERDLEEISMQVWDDDSENWLTVLVRGESFPRIISSDPKMIRFPVKWSDELKPYHGMPLKLIEFAQSLVTYCWWHCCQLLSGVVLKK